MLALMAVWGASYVAVKDALAHWPASAAVAGRFWLGALTLAPLLFYRGALADLRAAAGWGCVAGLALAAGFLVQSFGMRETSASMGGFLAGLIPLLVAAGGWVFLRARIGRVGLCGLVLGFAGMLCLAWPQASADGRTTDTLRGVLLQVVSSTSFATHVLLLSRVARRVPTVAFCMWQVVLTALAATLVVGVESHAVPWSETAHQLGNACTWRLGADLAYLGVLATGIGIAVQVRVQPDVPPLHVALLFSTQPLFAAAAGALLLGDAMRGLQAAGGGAIVLGIVVTSLDRRLPTPADVELHVRP